MPDQRGSPLHADEVFDFRAYYCDGSAVKIRVRPEAETWAKAEKLAKQATQTVEN